MSAFTMKAFIAASCQGVVFFDSSDIAGRIYPRVSFCRLALTENLCVSCHCHTPPPFTCAHDFLSLSLSGHRHLLRNVIRTAVGCDCASYS